jgi:hypothetical protein
LQSGRETIAFALRPFSRVSGKKDKGSGYCPGKMLFGGDKPDDQWRADRR